MLPGVKFSGGENNLLKHFGKGLYKDFNFKSRRTVESITQLHVFLFKISSARQNSETLFQKVLFTQISYAGHAF